MTVRPGRRRDIVMIGGSAGSIEALTKIVGAFPSDFPVSVFIVIHTSEASAYLPEIFNRNGDLPALMAQRNVPILPRRIYIAPPGRHLVLDGDHVRLVLGPRENMHRPSIDVLFRSSIQQHAKRVIATVLSGYRDDGSVGLALIKQHGGIAIVQEPRDALVPEMPEAAIEVAKPDYVLPADEIGELIVKLVQRNHPKRGNAREGRL
jgi:two-component system, chemotaxis family, protein-glutamate methylesterase/glutaminase